MQDLQLSSDSLIVPAEHSSAPRFAVRVHRLRSSSKSYTTCLALIRDVVVALSPDWSASVVTARMEFAAESY
jgi:hypothetical protein